MLMTFLAPNYYSELEPVSEGSDREGREFSDDEESNGETQQTNTTNLISFRHAGQPLPPYLCPKQDATFHLYAHFHHLIDYRLAHFFNSAKTSQANKNKFFKDGILKGLNLTDDIQFSSAYTMYKLVDAAADQPAWHSGIVHYPLLKGVRLMYRNIIMAVKYKLCQKAYEVDMVWEPHREYNKEGNCIYSEIHTAVWLQENQVRALRHLMLDV